MTKLNFPVPHLDEDVPEEIRRNWELADKLTSEIAQRVAKEVDDAITAAIELRLGHRVDPRLMVGRLHRTIFMDGSEVLVLDGVPLVHIGPWVFTLFGDTGATREITHLKGGDATLPN